MRSQAPISTRPTADAPRGWKWRLLTEVARLESGHTPSRRVAAYWESGDVPWLSLKDIRNLASKYVFDTTDKPTALGIQHSSARILPRGTVALCRTASVGKAAVLGIDMATSQDFVNWVCSDQISPEYLYWAFQSSQSTFELEKQGSTHQTMYIPTVQRFQVLLPPVSEQRRIAAILDKADTLRARRRAALAQLDTLTQSIFLDMFGDPARNPKNWPRRKVEELLESAAYGTSEKSGPIGEFPVLRMNNITRSGEIDLRELKYMDLSSEKRERWLVRSGDILFNRTNSADLVGKTAIYRSSTPVAFAGYLIRLRVNGANDPEYLAAFLNSAYAKRTLRGMCKSIIGMANINATEVQSMVVPTPPVQLQHEFAKRVALAEAMKVPHRTFEGSLDALFASLQQRAFRGEL